MSNQEPGGWVLNTEYEGPTKTCYVKDVYGFEIIVYEYDGAWSGRLCDVNAAGAYAGRGLFRSKEDAMRWADKAAMVLA